MALVTGMIRFVTWPLKTAPALVIVVFSLLLVLAIKASILGIPLALILLTGFFNYAVVLLDSVADGAAEPPTLSVEMMNPVESRRAAMLLFVILLLTGATHGGALWLGGWFNVAGAIASAALLPALIAVQAATGSAWQALNLVAALGLIRRLRGDYLWLVGFLAIAILVCCVAFVVDGVPLLLRIALGMYVWLALCSLIGGVLHEHRAALGMDDALIAEPTDDDKQLQKQRDLLLDRIYAQWRGGARNNALRTIAAHIDAADDALSELKWLYDAGRKWPDPRLAAHLAREALPLLLAARRTGEALDLAREQLQLDGDFRPIAASQALDLARLARDAGDRRSARMLLRDFDRFYPRDPAHAMAQSLSRQLEG